MKDFDWDSYEDEDGSSEEFNFDEFPEAISTADAVKAGLVQGGTAGFGDEMGAAQQTSMDILQKYAQKFGLADEKSPTQVDEELLAQGFTGDLEADSGEVYTTERDRQRVELAKIQEAQPGAFLGGAIAGSIPGAIASAPLGAGSKLAQAGILAGEGALAGAGTSEEEDIAGIAKDTAQGAALGLALPAGLKVAGKVAKPALKAAGKVGKAVLSPAKKLLDFAGDSELARRFKQGFSLGKAGKPIHTQKFRDKLTDEVIESAEDSVESLTRMKKDALSMQAGALDDAVEKGIGIDATQMAKKFADEFDTLSTKFADELPSDELKLFSKNLQNLLNKGGMIDIDAATLKKIQSNFRNFTKKGATPFADSDLSHMSQKIVDDINSIFKEALPEVRQADEFITKINNLLEKTKLRRGGKDIWKDMDKEERMVSVIKSLSGDSITSTQQLKNVKKTIDDLIRLFPEDSVKLKQYDEMLNRIDLKEGQQTSTVNKYLEDLKKLTKNVDELPGAVSGVKRAESEGIDVSLLGGRSISTRGGSAIGSAYKNVQEMIKAPAEQFAGIAQRVAQDAPNSASAQNFARIMTEMAEADPAARNALIFGLQQSPQYRELMKEYLQFEE